MDKFWKIVAVVAVVAVVESQEHRPLVLSGQHGGSNYMFKGTFKNLFKKWTLPWKNISCEKKNNLPISNSY